MSEEQRVVSDLVWTPERGTEIPEVRGISWENFLLSDDKYLGKWKTDSGIRITPETALQSTVVLSCCRILAETVSGLLSMSIDAALTAATRLRRKSPFTRF